ncbi:MAG: hypothetical protein QW474_00530 [Candidatus Aenigmatarchaeota archaeon]
MINIKNAKLINLTPHPITIFLSNGNNIELPPSGKVARCKEKTIEIGQINNIPIIKKELGEVYDLPASEENTYYIVSLAVAQAVKRSDLLVVGQSVRDEKGNIIGCTSLALIE